MATRKLTGKDLAEAAENYKNWGGLIVSRSLDSSLISAINSVVE